MTNVNVLIVVKKLFEWQQQKKKKEKILWENEKKSLMIVRAQQSRLTLTSCIAAWEQNEAAARTRLLPVPYSDHARYLHASAGKFI